MMKIKKRYCPPGIKVRVIAPPRILEGSVTATPDPITDDSEEKFGDNAKQSFFILWTDPELNNDY